MESQYYEHIVRCKPSMAAKLLRIVSIVVFILSLLMFSAGILFALAGCLVMGGLFWYSNREAGKEFEYVYVDGDISFDAVYNKSKRKSQLKTKWEETKLVCRGNAPELEGYRQKNAKTQNYTSNMKPMKDVYALVIEREGVPIIVYCEPADEMIEMMWRKAPSKVKR